VPYALHGALLASRRWVYIPGFSDFAKARLKAINGNRKTKQKII